MKQGRIHPLISHVGVPPVRPATVTELRLPMTDGELIASLSHVATSPVDGLQSTAGSTVPDRFGPPRSATR